MKEFWNAIQMVFTAIGGLAGLFPWQLRRTCGCTGGLCSGRLSDGGNVCHL